MLVLTWSLFLESYNVISLRKNGNLTHGTKAVQIQMFRNFMKVQLVHQFAKRCLINAPGSVTKCYAKLLGGNTESRYRENEVGCSTLGKRKRSCISGTAVLLQVLLLLPCFDIIRGFCTSTS